MRDEIPRVSDVRYLHDHVVWLRFSDGLEGEADLRSGLRGPIFAPLLDPGFFSRVSIEYGALAWPNGADWAPESLHSIVVESRGHQWRETDDAAPPPMHNLGDVPEISRFFGIVIRMLANDHVPPHFHATYGEYEATFTIRDGIVTGRFPGRVLRMVLEWRDLHETELLENWDRLRDGKPPRPIPPLV